MRNNRVTLSEQQKSEFESKLSKLLNEYRLMLDEDSYLDTPFIKVVDCEGNWSVLESHGNTENTYEILDKDFWE